MSEQLRDRLQLALGDAYAIERELATGTWCTFVARSADSNRDVVVKVLADEQTLDRAGADANAIDVARFKRELSFAARLEDPTIVPILAWGDASGRPYFTMPFIAGGSLAGVKLPADRALFVLRDVARAMEHAHGRGVLHRDLSAHHIFLSSRGGEDGAIVAGFGVARALDAALGRAPDPPVDNRTDILAFGALADGLVEGERRASLTALIARCTAPNPANRPESASEIVAALDDMLSPSLGLLEQFWPTESATIDARREYYRGRLAITLVVVVVLVAIAAYFAARSSSKPLVVAPPSTAATRAAKRAAPHGVDSLAAVAWSWLDRADSSMAAKDAVPQARTAIARGLTLDPSNTSLRFLEGVVAYLYDRDAAAALGFMRDAIAADPNVAGATTWYPQVLWANGQRDTATAFLRAAVARDTASRATLDDAWSYAHRSGDALRALQYCGTLRQIRANGRCEALQLLDVSRTDSALSMTQQAAKAGGERDVRAQLEYVSVLVAANRLDDAKKIVAAVDRQAAIAGSYMRPDDIALMHGAIGDTAGALRWLDRAASDGSGGVGALYWRTIDNPIRTDPRLLEFAHRAGLKPPPSYWP